MTPSWILTGSKKGSKWSVLKAAEKLTASRGWWSSLTVFCSAVCLSQQRYPPEAQCCCPYIVTETSVWAWCVFDHHKQGLDVGDRVRRLFLSCYWPPWYKRLVRCTQRSSKGVRTRSTFGAVGGLLLDVVENGFYFKYYVLFLLALRIFFVFA